MCVRNQLPAINIILQILFKNMYPSVGCVSISVAVYQIIRILIVSDSNSGGLVFLRRHKCSCH